MSIGKGWPDAANPGFPSNPNQEGPHLIIDQHDQRRWYFWFPAGMWFSGSFQCSPAFAAEHWRYIGSAIAPNDVSEFAEEDVWSNYRYPEDLQVAMRSLVHEIVRSCGLNEGWLFDVKNIAHAFIGLASTDVFHKIVANELNTQRS
jgi:hypothetical protein